MIAFRSIEYKEDKTPYIQLNLTDDNNETNILKFDNKNMTVNWINCVKKIPENYIITSSNNIDEVGEEYTWVYALGDKLFKIGEVNINSDDYLEIPILIKDLEEIETFEELVTYYRSRNV